MGLWFPKRLPGQTRPAASPRPPKPAKPKPKPKSLPYLALVVGNAALIVGGLTVLLVLPWP